MSRKTQDILITIVAGMSMLLSTLDTGIINVALSFLEVQFQTTTSNISLAITGYALALAITIIPFGLLSDRFGKLNICLFGFIVFGLSSLFCGLAHTVTSLITSRIIQGIGAAALQATSAALIMTLVSNTYKHSAISILGIMIGLGPILGPSLGGIFLSLHLWPFIFWINIPFTIIGILCIYSLRRTIVESTHIPIMENVTTTKHAIIMAKDTSVKAYLLQTGAFGFASSMIFLLPPYLFEHAYHLEIGLIGFLVLSAPLGLVIFSRVSSALNTDHNNRQYSHIGLVLMCLSLLGLIAFNTNWPYLSLSILLFIYGIGGGYFQPANIANIMQSSPMTIQGTTSALQRMIQNMSISIGSAIGAMCLHLWSTDLVWAIRISWIIALVIMAISLCSTLGLINSYKANN